MWKRAHWGERPESDTARSLLELLSGEIPSRALYAESSYGAGSFGWAELISVIEGDDQLIVARRPDPGPELFDLESDPGETINRIGEDRRRTGELHAMLQAYEWGEDKRQATDRETAAALRSLGYLSSGANSSPGEVDRPDPRAKVETLELLMRGLEEFRRREFATAEASLRLGLEEHPGLIGGWEHFAQAVAAQGRPDEAIAIYRDALTALEGDEGAIDLSRQGAEYAISLGRLEAALELVRHQLVQTPAAAPLRSLEVRLLLATGSGEQARRVALRNAAEAPAEAEYQYDYAVVERTLGNPRAAEAALEQTLELDPRHVDALNDLAVRRAAAGQLNEAIRFTERALVVAPGHPLAVENLATFRRANAE